MKQEIVEHEILEQVMKLLEKAGFDEIAPMPSSMESNESHSLESSLITLRNLNARYDRDDAVSHIRSLMHRYNIQLDELMDSRGIL